MYVENEMKILIETNNKIKRKKTKRDENEIQRQQGNIKSFYKGHLQNNTKPRANVLL